MPRNNRDTVPDIKSKKGQRLVVQMTGMGFPEHRIAAAFDVNSGRVAESLQLSGTRKPKSGTAKSRRMV